MFDVGGCRQVVFDGRACDVDAGVDAVGAVGICRRDKAWDLVAPEHVDTHLLIGRRRGAIGAKMGARHAAAVMGPKVVEVPGAQMGHLAGHGHGIGIKDKLAVAKIAFFNPEPAILTARVEAWGQLAVLHQCCHTFLLLGWHDKGKAERLVRGPLWGSCHVASR